MDVYVVIFMFVLLFCIIAVCAPLFIFFFDTHSGIEKAAKENKTDKNNERIARFAIFFLFHFLPPDKCECGIIYVCILLACCILLFSISVLPVLFGERKRIARHVSLIFRLKMYGSIVLGALGGFNGLIKSTYRSDRVDVHRK